MNDYFLAILLGIVEGVTEFLPISSTAHLRIVQASLGLNLQDEFWKMFSVVIQLGAILSVAVYFRRRILDLFRDFSLGPRRDHPLLLTLLAFFVTAVPAFFLSKLIGKNLENLTLIGWSLLIGGVVMAWTDRITNSGDSAGSNRIKCLEEMRFAQALWVGAIQILSAVFPGISRSMSTIVGGQLAGLNRATALEFSFFVSIPTMIAATGYDLVKSVFRSPGNSTSVVMDAQRWSVLGLGFLVSFLVAWAVIAWFMNWVRTRGFIPFAIYRIILGALVVLFSTGVGT